MEEPRFSHWARGAGKSESQNHLDCVQMTKSNGFKWSDTDCVFTKASPICERNINIEKEEQVKEEKKKGEEVEEEEEKNKEEAEEEKEEEKEQVDEVQEDEKEEEKEEVEEEEIEEVEEEEEKEVRRERKEKEEEEKENKQREDETHSHVGTHGVGNQNQKSNMSGRKAQITRPSTRRRKNWRN